MNKRIILASLALSALFLTSCDKETPFNSELNPTGPTIDWSKAKVVLSSDLSKIQLAPVLDTITSRGGTISSDYSREVYAYLNAPAPADITVKVAIDPSASTEGYAISDVTVLPEGVFTLENATLTIKKGEIKSTQAVVLKPGAKFTEAFTAQEVDTKTAVALKVESVSNAEVEPSLKYPHLLVPFIKDQTNLKVADEASFSSKTELKDGNITYAVYNQDDIDASTVARLYDGNVNSAWQATYGDTNASIAVDLDGEKTITGIRFGASLDDVSRVVILTSEDGENWVSQGSAIPKYKKGRFGNRSTFDMNYLEFYTPVKASYVALQAEIGSGRTPRIAISEFTAWQ